MEIAALIAIITLFGLGVFQAFIASGKPWGEYAWGGQIKILPKKLRAGSLFSIFLYVLFAIILADRAELIDALPDGFRDWAIWALLIYAGLGVLLNTISRSKKERMVMVPVTVILFTCTLIVATA